MAVGFAARIASVPGGAKRKRLGSRQLGCVRAERNPANRSLATSLTSSTAS
jgi:hypothetical protein